MSLKISEVRKGMRVRPADGTLFNPLIPRIEGTVRSPKAIANKRPYEEGIGVYVKWDGLPTPEKWHLRDLESVAADVRHHGEKL